MKLMHRSLLLFLTLVVLIANIGLSVFTHWCEEDGAFISYVIPTDDHCGDQEQLELLPACCKKDAPLTCANVEERVKDDCCSDAYSWIKLSVDQDQSSTEHQQIKIDQFDGVIFLSSSILIVKINLNQPLYSGVDPPPCLRGRQILIKNQVFQI